MLRSKSSRSMITGNLQCCRHQLQNKQIYDVLFESTIEEYLQEKRPNCELLISVVNIRLICILISLSKAIKIGFDVSHRLVDALDQLIPFFTSDMSWAIICKIKTTRILAPGVLTEIWRTICTSFSSIRKIKFNGQNCEETMFLFTIAHGTHY